MIGEYIAHLVQRMMAAVTPWLVGSVVGLLALWLVMQCRRLKVLAAPSAWFTALTPARKVVAIALVCLFTFLGGSKERGILPSGLIDGISSTMTRVVETIQLRTPPENVASNAFAVTDFAVDSQEKEVAFEVGWADNLFENVDSRNVDLFMSTNLAENGWFWLGRYLMPQGTNSHAFTVSSNDVALACRPLYVDSFSRMAFFRFGLDFDSDGDGLTDAYESFVSFTDPSNPDTDGDGLSDSEELSAGVGTDPLLYDTDGDGVGDGDEVAAGSNPRSADTDRDGLSDAQELGAMSAHVEDGFVWMDMQDATPLVTWPTASGDSWRIPLVHGAVVNGVCYTNAKVHVDGTVHLLCPTNVWDWGDSCSYGALSNTQYSASHISIALCGAYLYAKTNEWQSQILHGVASRGGQDYTVVEYRNIGLSDYTDTNELITCQLILPHDETNTVYVSYLCVSNLFREAEIRAGVQFGWMRSWKPGERFYNLSWPLTPDFPQGGLTIKYSLGTGTNPLDADTDGDGLTDSAEVMIHRTDPLVSDTDGDGLPDGEEIAIGTNPLDADSDNDGMTDGWEVGNALNPMADDSAEDPDSDGMANLDEYRAGTDPNDPDTDHDGLSDLQECVLGTDPLLPDTDGDGLADAEEIDAGTDPLSPDTDGDGLTDGWEHDNGLDPLSASGDDGTDGDLDGDGLSNLLEQALGTNPSNADTDGDGLADRTETGSHAVTNGLSWLTLPADAEDITAQFPDPDTSLVNHVLSTPITLGGETVTNAIIDLNGIVYLPRRGRGDGIYSRNGANLAYEICTNALVLAPYLADLYLTTNAPASAIKIGETALGTNPVWVVQYENVCPYSNRSRDYTTNALSFQVVIPINGEGEVHFLYRDMIGDNMGGRNADVGIQALGGRWAHVYSYWEADGLLRNSEHLSAFVRHGALSDGLDLAFDIGIGTDPLNPDTDGDGLGDGEELGIGTAPLLSDTDGDGMNDGWELQHAGFDPLANNANDDDSDNDGDADPDNDGATNRQESEAGTDPANPDTDGDGLNDGTEIGQGSDPNDRADTVPVKWVTVTGDLREGEPKEVNETVEIPAGATVYVGVFVHSDEYPDWTGRQSEYNDALYWNIHADGQQTLTKRLRVNNEDISWGNADIEDWEVDGFAPVILKEGAIYRAGSTNLSVTLTLRAMNIRDGALPSSVIVGFFPLKVVQSNMPTGTGVANTTDAATSYVRAAIPTNGVAYITGQPAAPQLTAQFKGLPWWIGANWSGNLVSERAEYRSTLDDRTLTAEETSGDEEYDVLDALHDEIVGGRCTLNVQVEDSTVISYPFFIRGKNPLDATARAYITANVDAEFQPYAWMIAKHESKSGSRVYNQFNPSGSKIELPNKTDGTNTWGWGIAQIDKGRNGTSTAEVYDWHANVASMNATLISKRRRYNEIIGWYRAAYQDDASTHWIEPDNVLTNVNGTVISGRQWAIMTLYNGAGGTHPVPFAEHADDKTPIHFDPVTTNWVLYTNSNNYVPVVYGDASTTEVE